MTRANPKDVAAIQRLRDMWVEAVVRRDAAALRELVTEDYEVWAHGAPTFRGRDTVETSMRSAMEKFDIEPGFEAIETVIAGDWAFQRGLEKMRVTPRGGGESQTREQRALLIMHRGADGQWRYARGMTNGLPSS